MSPESRILYQIPGWNSEFGTTLNNANVAKALAAGVPFWGEDFCHCTVTSPAKLAQQIPAVISGGPQQVNPNVNPAAAQAFAQSLQNTQAVSSILSGTPYNNNDDISTQNDLASSVSEAQNLLQLAISLMMSDMPTFTS